MVDYRRNYDEGGAYFFTIVLKDRKSKLLIQEVELLYKCIRCIKYENFYRTIAQVVLPDHIHLLWKLPDGDSDYSNRIRKIKSYFTKELKEQGHILSKNEKGQYDVWQSRYWEHTIRDEEDLENHFNYIHYNPVKHGYVKNVKDWPYSTFHYYVKKGLLEEDWGGIEIKELKKSYGE